MIDTAENHSETKSIKLSAKKERYKIQKDASDAFTKNFFILPIVTGTLTVLALNYSLEKCYNFPSFILFISLAIATFAVWRYMKLALEVSHSSLKDGNEIGKLVKTQKACFKYFTTSIILLFAGMFVIFCCKISLYSKILALV